MNSLQQLRAYVAKILDLSLEREREEDTIEAIRSGVEFKGANLWVLIFAIFIASLGLNTNSTAVIIGAMLISPLMGPIMGIGLGVGINDFELIKKSFRNLAVATIFSVLASTFYFLLSPLNEARSELLARTTPTIYDVLIALFGGLAGVVASCSKLKGNVIPGVAIATALMPPLCTAGFGLASGNLNYFFGAFYLYTINSVFIALATTLGVRFMHFSKKTFVDKVREKKVQQIVYAIILVTIIPSVYITYNMVKTNIFENNASRFITNEINFPNTLVVHRDIRNAGGERVITVSLIGKELPDESVMALRQKMGQYGLQEVQLTVLQGFGKEKETGETNSLNNLVLQDFYKINRDKVIRQEAEIATLKAKLDSYTAYDSLGSQIVPELKILFPEVSDITIAHVRQTAVDSEQAEPVTLVLVTYRNRPGQEKHNHFKAWLSARLGVENIKLVVE